MESLADLQHAAMLHPTDRETWLRVSAAAKVAGDTLAEFKALRRLVSLKPSDGQWLRRIAAILTGQDDADATISAGTRSYRSRRMTWAHEQLTTLGC